MRHSPCQSHPCSRSSTHAPLLRPIWLPVCLPVTLLIASSPMRRGSSGVVETANVSFLVAEAALSVALLQGRLMLSHLRGGGGARAMSN